ncbi:MAG: DTW domain-containing protein, partial [Comamonas sp.]|nr:DTW domain-containing protein [Candidatus Comamonas equi]
FLARGGPKGERCEGCRLRPSHCLCALRPLLPTHAGICLLTHDAEPLEPSNTGWLIADVVQDTFAFGWSRLEQDPGLVALLSDPQWQPYVVFPGEFVQPPERVIHTLPAAQAGSSKRPLFIMLDATWSEARKMFRKSPYLEQFPVLSLQSEQLSRYQLRRSKREDHFCTSEVAALCLELSGAAHDVQDVHAGQVLERYLEVYTHHYLRAKNQLLPQLDGEVHAHFQQTLRQNLHNTQMS